LSEQVGLIRRVEALGAEMAEIARRHRTPITGVADRDRREADHDRIHAELSCLAADVKRWMDQNPSRDPAN
jgi:hypothetical protein